VKSGSNEVTAGPIFVKAFFGNFDLVIDEKNRLLIPAEVRRVINPEVDGNVLYLMTGNNDKAWLWPEKLFLDHAEGRGSTLTPEAKDLEFDQLVFGCSHRLELDKQGRILIPEKAMKDFAIGKEITLFSARDHLEIWDRNAFIEWRRDLESRRQEIMSRKPVHAAPQEAEPQKK
jgi:MraZ protein